MSARETKATYSSASESSWADVSLLGHVKSAERLYLVFLILHQGLCPTFVLRFADSLRD